MNKNLLQILVIFLLLGQFLPFTVLAFELIPVPKIVYPTDNPWSQDKEDLGKLLFFDPRLSGNNKMSCSTCHQPNLGWGDGLARAIGHEKKELGRNTPTIINSGYSKKLFWDGRASSLEEQALGPIQASKEMNQNLEELVVELVAVPEYVDRFKKVFGPSGITAENIAKSLAVFEKKIVTKNSSFDNYLGGDKKAISSSAVRGINLFFGKAKCSVCHSGPNFTDHQFHNIGVKQQGPLKKDVGRQKITKEKFHLAAFKTTGLRDITKTAPYMHDGSVATLEAVIDFYNQGGKVKENISPFINPIGLSEMEKKDLIAFLKSLEGDPIQVSVPQLP